MIIQNFDDFVSGLLEAGFSMGGGNSEGIFSLITMKNKISEHEAIEKITERIYKLNPDANIKKIVKFIKG